MRVLTDQGTVVQENSMNRIRTQPTSLKLYVAPGTIGMYAVQFLDPPTTAHPVPASTGTIHPLYTSVSISANKKKSLFFLNVSIVNV